MAKLTKKARTPTSKIEPKTPAPAFAAVGFKSGQWFTLRADGETTLKAMEADFSNNATTGKSLCGIYNGHVKLTIRWNEVASLFTWIGKRSDGKSA